LQPARASLRGQIEGGRTMIDLHLKFIKGNGGHTPIRTGGGRLCKKFGSKVFYQTGRRKINWNLLRRRGRTSQPRQEKPKKKRLRSTI